MNNEIDRLKGRIWITERCHMKAEKRKRFLENYFHITLALYAIASISLTLFEGETSRSIDGNLIALTSVCTLTLSLLVFGFRFGETAAQHRACYLGLQKLRSSPAQTEDDLNQKYIDTLSYYPNHSTNDYLDVVISNVFFSKQKMEDASGNPVHLPIVTRIKYSFFWLIYRLIGMLFAIIPIEITFVSSGYWSIFSYLRELLT